ncbi:DUF2889 domain-containing protein [Novosphingobium bradum]|uniref:DUF2889 domain-containing protein n=2 Tax=Novosphingobium bradum TaxID=1737444 RepID=A0ABV7IQV2_9SPHN
MHMVGRARDLLTLADPAIPAVLAEGGFEATVTPDRQILALETEPARPGTAALVGSRAGSQLRGAIAEALPEDLRGGTPLYLLLDDVAGASLVAPWAWSQWADDWLHRMHSAAESGAIEQHRRKMMGVCVGFSPESPVYQPGGRTLPDMNRTVVPLDGNGDPFAWHALSVQDGPSARRARRIEVSLDGPTIRVETHFQDSAPMPEGGRTAVHEYLVRATIDRASLTLTSLEADPRILPFSYCPAATLNIGRVVGTPVRELRQRVLTEFARTEGCTHLNDVMRSLAEVPLLAQRLEAALGAAEAG